MTARARVLDYVCLVAGLWLAWVLVFQWAGPEALSPPGATLQRMGEYLTSAQFWPHSAATGLAFAYACVIALIGGLLLGLALGANRLAGEVGEPILSSLYSIPKVTLYPVILLVFGLGISAKVAFGALHGIFPVALFAIGALRNTSPVLIKTARVLRLAPVETVRTVLLPAALPEIITGLRIGFSATLLGTLIGELFASDQHLGFTDTRHGGAQGARHHGADAAAVRICRERECAVACGRAAPTPAVSAAAFAEQADQPRCGSQPQEMERDEVAKRHRLMLLWNGVKFMLLHDAMGESAFGAVESGTSDGSTQFCR